MSDLPDTPPESPLPPGVEDDSEPAPPAAPGTAVMPLTKDAIEKFLKFVPILPESVPAGSCAGVCGAHTAWAPATTRSCAPFKSPHCHPYIPALLLT